MISSLTASLEHTSSSDSSHERSYDDHDHYHHHHEDERDDDRFSQHRMAHFDDLASRQRFPSFSTQQDNLMLGQDHTSVIHDTTSGEVEPPSDVDITESSSSRWRHSSNDYSHIFRPQPTGDNPHRNKAYQMQLPCLLFDALKCILDAIAAGLDVWVEVLTSRPLPWSALHKVSILLLAMEHIRAQIDRSTFWVVLVASDGDGDTTIFPMDVWGFSTSVPPYIIWGIPAAVALLSISFVLILQLSWGSNQDEAVIATALIVLIFLEALLPLFILGCTSLYLFQQVSWETGLLLLAVVWLGSTACATCVRRVLYQSLGHG